MAGWLKQSTAVTVKLGPFVDSTDGVSAETGLTITQADVRLSKNGGDMAQKNDTTSCTHDELGYYDCPLSTTDTGTLGRLRVMVSESGALPVWQDFMVVPAAVYDALFGSAYLPVNVEKWNAVDVPSGQTDGYPMVSLQDGVITDDVLDETALEAVVDAILDELLAGHAVEGSVGEALGASAVDLAEVVDAAVGEVTPGAEPTTLGGLVRMIYNRAYRRNELTDSVLRTYGKDAVGGSTDPLTSQTVSDDGTTQIQQQATYPS